MGAGAPLRTRLPLPHHATDFSGMTARSRVTAGRRRWGGTLRLLRWTCTESLHECNAVPVRWGEEERWERRKGGRGRFLSLKAHE